MRLYKALIALLAWVTACEVASASPELEVFESGVGVLALGSGGTAGPTSFGGYNIDITTADLSTPTAANFNISFGISGTSTTPLEIRFSDVGFDFSGGVNISLSVTTLTGSLGVMTAAFGGTSDNFFDTTSLLASVGPLTGTSSGSDTGGSLSGGPFSLTEVVTISTPGGSTGGNISGASRLTGGRVPDGGSTMALLGGALIGLGVLSRKARSFKAIA